MKKLNLKWVTEIIGEDYKKWKEGDVVVLQAQTGTGKTYMVKTKLVPRLDDWENMLIVANRINLKRQLKRDLFDYYEIPIPKTDLELDKVTKIGNVTILSYQQIAEMQNSSNYNESKIDFNNYKYIICDECHFFLTDAGFNNKTDLSFEQLVTTRHIKSIKIFITATMEEIEDNVVKGFEDGNQLDFGYIIGENKIHRYSTGIDYSYLDIKYFDKIKNIIQLIRNDKTEDKWLIFVSNKEDGKVISNELEGFCSNSFITKDTKMGDSADLKSIINESKFNSKVLICTKAMDNGINIENNSVKNMVVISYDKTTFIQELGRVRVNIDNANNINLYIPCKSWNSFNSLLTFQYQSKLDLIELYKTDLNKFNMKYSRSYNKLPSDIFIINTKDNKSAFNLNILGCKRLDKDVKFCEMIMKYFEKNKKFAYILEQLKWIEMVHTFNKNNLIEDVISLETGIKLKEFLENAYNNNERFTKEFFQEEINKFINEDEGLKNVLYKLDNGKSRVKGAKKLNQLFRACNFDYIVGGKKFKVNGKLETKWIITKEE